PPQYLWATDELQRDIEQLFRTSGLHYDRRKNSWRKLGIGLQKVVGMTELAQSIAAIFLQEPDHARARPSRYFKKDQYTKVFSTKVPIELYVTCALLRKRAEAYLQVAESDRMHRNNLLFYLMMAVAPVKLKTPRANAKTLSGLKIGEIDDTVLASAFAVVRPL